MKNTLKISVDELTLTTNISLKHEDLSIINELKLICSGISDDYIFKNGVISLPWFEFRRGIQALALIRKKFDLAVLYDEGAKHLIQQTLDDKKNFKSSTAAIELTASEMEIILKNSGFVRLLKKEQTRDILKLLSIKHGANFSVPGAGKTTTILAIYTILRHFEIATKLFVVSPVNAFLSWEDEIAEVFEKEFSILRLQKNHFENPSYFIQSDFDIILVNYEKLRKDVLGLAKYFIKNKVHLVLDESHRIKAGFNNLSYTQIAKLSDLAKRRDILSGTPMPQSYLDLIPQFDFIWPGEKIINIPSNNLEDDLVLKSVNNAIQGLFVRTTKKELHLKNPVITYNSIAMGPIQYELYRLFKSESARILAGIDKITKQNFRRIGKSVVKLLQAATNPILLTSKDEYSDEIITPKHNIEFWELLEDFQKYEKPSKLEYVINRVKELLSKDSSKKILIWSYFIRNILILEKLLKEFNPVVIYGSVPTGEEIDENNREGRIRKFHEDASCKIMIANPQACGEGISLHKICHHAIYLDRNFNAAYFLQSIDRIHRLGLPENIETNIEILISKDSIDEILISRLNEKINAMGNVLDDPSLHSLAYDPEDILKEDETGLDLKDLYSIKEHVNQK